MKKSLLQVQSLALLLFACNGFVLAEIPQLLVQLPSQWQNKLEPIPDSATGSGLDDNARDKISAVRSQVTQALMQETISAKELADAYARLGAYYLHDSIYTLAELSYNNAAKLAPEDFRWLYYLAFTFHQSGRTDLALQHYARARQLTEAYPPLDLRVADLYLDLNQLTTAEKYYRLAVEHKEFAAPAEYGLGQIALLRRNYPAAIEHLNRVLQLDPGATQTHYPLAQAYRAVRQNDKAKQHLALYAKGKPEIDDPLIKVIKQLEQVAALHFNNAMTAVEQGKFDTALNEFKLGLELEPENAAAHVSYARVLFLADSGNKSIVTQELQYALRLDKENTLALFLLGILSEAGEDNSAAIRYYQSVLQVDPEHAGAHYYLSQLMIENEDYAAACPHITRTIEQEPMNLTAQLNFLSCLEIQNQSDAAIYAYLEKLRHRFPDLPLLRFLQVNILALSHDETIKNPQKALKSAQQLVEMQAIPPHFAALALANAAKGNFQQAADIQRELIKTAEKNNTLQKTQDEELLALYQAGKLPGLTKWFPQQFFMHKGAVDVTGPFRYYPAARPY